MLCAFLESVHSFSAAGRPFLGPCTFRQALLQWFDLTGIPRKGLIRVLAKYASDPSEKEQLLLLSDDEKAVSISKAILLVPLHVLNLPSI